MREIKRKRAACLHGHLFIMRCPSWMHSMMARGTCSLHYTYRTGEDKICDLEEKREMDQFLLLWVDWLSPLQCNLVQFLPPGSDSEPKRSEGR